MPRKHFKDFIPWLIYGIFFSLIISMILAINPTLLVSGRYRLLNDFEARTQRNGSFATISIETHGASKVEPKQAATFTYRGDLARRGMSDDEVIFPLQKVWETFQLNFGIHGASKSSPAVDESGIYLGTDTGRILAFDHDGKLKWEYSTYSPQGIHGTAVLSSDSVFIGSYNGLIYRISKATGRPIWVRKVADAVGSSGLLDHGEIYFSVETTTFRDGYIVKLNAETGAEIWRTRWLGEQIHSSPALSREESVIYVGANNGKLFKINAGTGKVIWEIDTLGPIKGTPAVLGQNVCVTSWSENFLCYDKRSGKMNLKVNLVGKSQSSPTLFAKEQIAVFTASSNEKSETYGVSLKKGVVLWRKSFNRKSESNLDPQFLVGSGTGLISKGKSYVVIACQSKVLCFLGVENGRLAQSINLPGPLTSVPTIWKSKVFISLNSGPLIKFEQKK